VTSRGSTMRTALLVARLAFELGYPPTPRELKDRLGMTQRTAYRWSAKAREVIAMKTRPHGPRVFAAIETA